MDNTKRKLTRKSVCNGKVSLAWYIHNETLVLDRVFINSRLRGKKLLRPAIQWLIDKANQEKLSISVMIMADNPKHDERLRNLFGSMGFIADKYDGDTYRNFLTKAPE